MRIGFALVEGESWTAEHDQASHAAWDDARAPEPTALATKVAALEHSLALATKQVVGPKSERMPTPGDEERKREGKDNKRGGHTNPAKRKKNAEAKAARPATGDQRAGPRGATSRGRDRRGGARSLSPGPDQPPLA